MLSLFPRTPAAAVLFRVAAMPMRASHPPPVAPLPAAHLRQSAASAVRTQFQQHQLRQHADFCAPPGLPKALHPPELPLPQGRFPKSALLEFFQGVLREHVTLQADTRDAAGGTFRCDLRTPPVDAVVSGWHVNLPELTSTAAGNDKKTAQHAAALDALQQLHGKLQVKELKPTEALAVAESEQLATKPSDDDLDAIEGVLGYAFRNRDLLRRAFWCGARGTVRVLVEVVSGDETAGKSKFTGSDVTVWHPSVGPVNNARLALVGDAVLDVCALTDAYEASPNIDTLSVEDMNTYRADRCCRASCTRIAEGMGLRPYVVTHSSYRDVRGGRVAADSMVAETLEAIVGAIFEDAGKGGAGMDRAAAFYKRHWPSVESWAAQAQQRGGPAASSRFSAAMSATCVAAAATGSTDGQQDAPPPAAASQSEPQDLPGEVLAKRSLNGLTPKEELSESAKKTKQQAAVG